MNEALKKSIEEKSIAKHVLGKKVRYEALKTKHEMLPRVEELISFIEEETLRESLHGFMINAFKSSPSSTGYHHAYPNGNLEHTVEVANISLKLCDEIDMPTLNRDIVIAGALLHDIGKEACYKFTETRIEETPVGKLNDHISIGIESASKYIVSEHLDKIIHVIASHHNLKEWGSPVQPAKPEAWIVHLADMFSAKLLG